MIENGERTLPIIVDAPLRWLRGRCNEARYGFPDGKSARERMEVLVSQERIGRREIIDLLDLMMKTSQVRLRPRMIEKFLIT